MCAPCGRWCGVAELVAMTARPIQHMHKALTRINVQIQQVIGDITGVTGLAIVDAILDGQRDPAPRAASAPLPLGPRTLICPI